jgi:lipopolysaccharide transport system permease protein
MGPLRPGRFAYVQELVLHLARRELNTRHRWTILGWAWPLTRVLAQLAVLVFVFSSILDLNIENYPVFVFSGIIAFAWFSSGISDGTSSLLSQRHLVLQPGFPTPVVPVVAVAVAFVDVLMALPVLILMLAISGDLSPTAAVFVPLLLVQLVLMCGLGWLAAALTVYLRDVPNVVTVGLTLLFYVTPVFYSVERVPEQYRWILQLNPLGTLIESYRWALLGDPFPGTVQFSLTVAASFLVAALGLVAFRRLRPGFADEL